MSGKLTEDMHDTLVEALGLGLRQGEAAALAGITRQTLSNWLRAGRKKGARGAKAHLARQVDAAIAKRRKLAMKQIYMSDDWRASVEFLDRTSEAFSEEQKLRSAKARAERKLLKSQKPKQNPLALPLGAPVEGPLEREDNSNKGE